MGGGGTAVAAEASSSRSGATVQQDPVLYEDSQLAWEALAVDATSHMRAPFLRDYEMPEGIPEYEITEIDPEEEEEEEEEPDEEEEEEEEEEAETAEEEEEEEDMPDPAYLGA